MFNDYFLRQNLNLPYFRVCSVNLRYFLVILILIHGPSTLIRNDHCQLEIIFFFIYNQLAGSNNTYTDRERPPLDFERERDLESRFSERDLERESRLLFNERERERDFDLDLERSRRL